MLHKRDMAQFTYINFKDSTTMTTTTNTTVFKRMGRILSLVFSDYNEARAFREAFLRLVTYVVLFIIGYRLNLVFDDEEYNVSHHHRLQAQPRIRQCP